MRWHERQYRRRAHERLSDWVFLLAFAGVSIPAATHAQTIGAGYGHTVALTPDGHVLTWGDNFYGQLGQGDVVDRLTPTQGPSLDGAR
jgi:alpha-tubulin suppressor-like RCC1 family protein